MIGFDENFQKPRALVAILLIHLLLIFLLLLNVSSIPFLDIGTISPFFLLMGIYFWTLARPQYLPLPIVLFYGLLMDFLSGGPVGLNGVAMLTIAYLTISQSKFLNAQGWLMVWIGFIFACVIVGIIQAIVFALINLNWPEWQPMFIGVLISSLAYPLLSYPMGALNRFIK